jgi:hypothetical protein
MNITSPITTAPSPISAHPHHGNPLLDDSDVVVPEGVTCTVAVRLVVLPGDCSVFVSVTVSVVAGSVIVLVSVLVTPPVSVVVAVSVDAAVAVPPSPATSQAIAAPVANAGASLPSAIVRLDFMATDSGPARRVAQRCDHDYRWRAGTTTDLGLRRRSARAPPRQSRAESPAR